MAAQRTDGLEREGLPLSAGRPIRTAARRHPLRGLRGRLDAVTRDDADVRRLPIRLLVRGALGLRPAAMPEVRIDAGAEGRVVDRLVALV